MPKKVLQKRIIAGFIVILAFACIAAFLLRPVLWKGKGYAVGDPYDPSFHAWTISWDVHAIFTNPFNLFNANIFFPNRYTLAYSEHEITNALLASPFLALSGDPIQSANITLYLNFILSGIGAYLLSKRLTKSRLSAFVSGIAFAFAPYMFSHITQLSICSVGWTPLSFLFLHRYIEDKKAYDAFLFALFFVLQFLSNTYVGLFLSVGVVIFIVVRIFFDRKTFTLKLIVYGALALILAAILIFPFAYPYIKVHSLNPGFERKLYEVEAHSADVQDFLVAPEFSFIWGKVTKHFRENTYKRAGPNARSLFPGLIIFILAILGAASLFRNGKGEERFYFWAYLSICLCSASFCLGPSLFVFGRRASIPMPYDILYRFYPGLRALRVPTIFSVLTTLSLAVLAGFGARALAGFFSKRGRNVEAFASVVLVALIFLDVMTTSLPLAPLPRKKDFPKVYSWLASKPGDAPTLELPMPRDDGAWVVLESRRTYFSTLHWKKIVNGFSSFKPPSYNEAKMLFRNFPDDKCERFLKRDRIQFLIIHTADAWGPELVKKLTKYNGKIAKFKLEAVFNYDYAYSVIYR